MAALPEFQDLPWEKALENFGQRIAYYEQIYEPLSDEPNRILVDSFDSCKHRGQPDHHQGDHIGRSGHHELIYVDQPGDHAD